MIPDGVTSIEGWAFDGCSDLLNIIISEGVRSIGGGAFWSSSSLTSVSIPEGVMDISTKGITLAKHPLA